MHELPVIQNICNIVNREAERLNAAKVISIKIKQGEYSDYVPEILQQYFDMMSQDTKAQGAKLEIENIPAVIYCRDCGKESHGEHMRLRCPICNGDNTLLKSGREFYIESMEIED